MVQQHTLDGGEDDESRADVQPGDDSERDKRHSKSHPDSARVVVEAEGYDWYPHGAERIQRRAWEGPRDPASFETSLRHRVRFLCPLASFGRIVGVGLRHSTGHFVVDVHWWVC